MVSESSNLVKWLNRVFCAHGRALQAIQIHGHCVKLPLQSLGEIDNGHIALSMLEAVSDCLVYSLSQLINRSP